MEQDRRIKHKIFFVDIEKIQRFIDDYREKGYKLEKVETNWFKYTFVKCRDTFIPKVQIDYRTFSKKDEYENYVAMYEDAGWKLISGDFYSGTHFFEQINENTSEDIFSDKESYSKLYGRLFKYALFVFLICIIWFFTLIKVYDFSMLTHPKDLFLTPGLWEATGIRFLAGFIFELPFVIWRNGAFIIWMAFLIISLTCVIKSKMKEIKYSANLN